MTLHAKIPSFFYWKSFLFLSASQLLIKARSGQVTFTEKPYIKINRLKKQKHWYLIHTWSGHSFKGSSLKLNLSPLHEGSHEITLTFPLKSVVFSRGNCFMVIFHGLKHWAFKQKENHCRACVIAPGQISGKLFLALILN